MTTSPAVFATPDDLVNAVGTALPTTDWVVVDQQSIDTFADATGDHQWIHVDAERAKTGPFGGTIAHGYLTLSLIGPLVADALSVPGGASSVVNYGLEKVRFPPSPPVPADSRIRLSSTITAVDKVPRGSRSPSPRQSSARLREAGVRGHRGLSIPRLIRSGTSPPHFTLGRIDYMTVTGSAGGRAAPVAVVGLACTPFVPEHDAVLDELVYDVVSRALGEAALRKQDIGLTVTASMDIYDGRSISSGLTNSASGGYLQDSYRLESDSGTAILAAAEAISSGDVEVAVAVGVYNPESTSRGAQRRAFLEQISNLAFDPHFARPVGLTAEATYALHTAWALEHDVEITELADIAAGEINKSVGHFRSVRRARVTGADVLSADPANGALTELMLPAYGTGAVAVVLASPARAARLQAAMP